jgi:hypothetical protein
MIDSSHARDDLNDDAKAWLQTTHAECLAQLAVFPEGREALLRQGSAVTEALQAVAEAGLTQESREHASAALMAMSDRELQLTTEGQKHIMISYNWNVQSTIARVNDSLLARGYATWFDLTNMK